MESQAGTYTLVIEASHAAGATTAAVAIGIQPLDNYPPIFTLSTTTANIKQGRIRYKSASLQAMMATLAWTKRLPTALAVAMSFCYTDN